MNTWQGRSRQYFSAVDPNEQVLHSGASMVAGSDEGLSVPVRWLSLSAPTSMLEPILAFKGDESIENVGVHGVAS